MNIQKMIPTGFTRKGMIGFALLMAGALGLSYYGWSETFRAAGVEVGQSELWSRVVDLVKGENVLVVGQVYQSHWTLELARWGIKALLLLAVLQTGAYFFRRQWLRWRFRRVAGHHVYAGLSDVNVELVRRSLAAGARVAVIDPDEQHPERLGLEAKGVLFLCGNATDGELLRASGLAKAARMVVGTTSDEVNVTIVEKATDLLQDARQEGPEMVVSIESTGLRSLLVEHWELLQPGGRHVVKVVGSRTVALRHLLTDLTTELAGRQGAGSTAPRLLVVAGLSFTAEFLKLAVPFIQISGDHKPLFAVCGFDEKARRAFLQRHPELELVAQIEFLPVEAQDIDLSGGSFDAAVVHMEGEVQTLRTACRLLVNGNFQIGAVKALVDTRPRIRLRTNPRLQVIAIPEAGLQSHEFGDDSLERLARDNHQSYIDALPEGERAGAPQWAGLPEAFKESNRLAVIHRPIKQTIWNISASSGRDAVLEVLASSEHQRWMAEKIMDGWRGGVVRDNQRKVHPDIKPYQDLSEEVKQKDRVQVSKALGLTL